ncbi:MULTISPECIES: PAS domain-containing protein [Phenylobacterium]|uniref:PAS domain-containing protein n=1 Tax=Phenylobacterium koreense TaxID=266125 RepID=A0ABV2EM05_9CAUL
MYHSNTQQMIDYWRSKRGPQGLPPRNAIDPTEFARLAPQSFILGRAASGLYPIRLVGGLIAELHGRDLRGLNFLALADDAGRRPLHASIEVCRRRPEPMILRADGQTEQASLPLEILLAPLAGTSGSPERLLGLYQPLALVSSLGELPVRQLAVRSICGVGPANEESHQIRLATLDGRRVA